MGKENLVAAKRYILAKEIREESIINGIIVPEVAEAMPNRAEILSLPTDCDDLPMKVGDTILYRGTLEFKTEDDTFQAICPADVICYIPKEKKFIKDTVN